MDTPDLFPDLRLIPTHAARSFTMLKGGFDNLYFTTCWNAQTLEAHSNLFGRTVWSAIPCGQWSCRQCAAVKIGRLSHRVNKAQPNRLLTLTIDPALWDTPRDSFDGTRRNVPELIRKLRLRFGDVEYLRVTELTSKGWPHYHLLVRSPYMPHAVVKGVWKELTGASIVDLRQVKNKFQCYTYLVKYLSKMHNLGWTNRHVSYSRKFLPPEPERPKNPFQLVARTVIESRPGTYLHAAYRGATFQEIAHGVYALKRADEPDPDLPLEEDPEEAFPPVIEPPSVFQPLAGPRQKELPWQCENPDQTCPQVPPAGTLQCSPAKTPRSGTDSHPKSNEKSPSLQVSVCPRSKP